MNAKNYNQMYEEHLPAHTYTYSQERQRYTTIIANNEIYNFKEDEIRKIQNQLKLMKSSNKDITANTIRCLHRIQ